MTGKKLPNLPNIPHWPLSPPLRMLTFPRESEPIKLADRARRYVEKMPPAISGSGGDNALFTVACVLVHGFDLPEVDAWQIILEYNNRCVPPWSERELQHKLASANCLSRHSKPRGYLRGIGFPAGYLLPIPEKPKRVEWKVKAEPLPPKGPQVLPREALTPILDNTLTVKTTTRWDARMLTGNAQRRSPEEHTAFLMAAFDSEEIFDFSNPSDVAEYEELYRRNL
jgi:hypothetical protein